VSGDVVDVISQIREQLRRLDAGRVAGTSDDWQRDMIVVGDLGDGDVLLTASPAEGNFYWHGSASDVLARLVGLPDASGARAIRFAFASHPDSGE
jgi:hypothetical protein